jgi:hypothetical protein
MNEGGGSLILEIFKKIVTWGFFLSLKISKNQMLKKN